ncbi:hypothetical protein MTO96_031056, partial [Rhipicephalus appendiculatus]
QLTSLVQPRTLCRNDVVADFRTLQGLPGQNPARPEVTSKPCKTLHAAIMRGARSLAPSPRPDRPTASSDVLPESSSTITVPCLLIPPPKCEVDVPVVENWGCTQEKVMELFYTWKINHTSICQEYSVLKGSIFPARPSSELKECLKANANRSDEDNKENFPACLQPVFGEESELFCKFELSSLDANRAETTTIISHETFHFAGKDWGFEKLIRTDILPDKAIEPLPDGKPTMYCEVHVLRNANIFYEYSNTVWFKVPKWPLSEDFGNLSESRPVGEAPLAMFEYETEEKLLPSNNSELRADCSFSITIANREGTEIVHSHETIRFVQGKDCGFENSLPTDVLLNNVSGLLPEDKLTIYCEAHVLEKSKDDSETNNSVQLKIARWWLSEGFRDLLGGHKFCVATMSYNGLAFYAQKAILSTQPPVLAAITKHETEEESQVEITDMGHEALHEMLRYIYTGETPNLDSMTIDLLAAADKYVLEHLKIACQEDLRLRLSADTVAEVLILADAYNADRLKVSCHRTNATETAGLEGIVHQLP